MTKNNQPEGNSASFNFWTFFTGFTAGMIVRSTDIFPLMSGLILGLTIQNLPSLLQMENIPGFLANGYDSLIDTITGTLSREGSKKLKLKKKTF